MHQILNALRRIILAAVVLFALGVLAVFAPMWATPIALLWYEPGFESAVAEALTEIPYPENACVYDDTRHMFVTTVGQLDAERMIEKAVREKAPVSRVLLRYPHFRVFNGRNTFYWSFRDRKFQVCRGDTWTLAETGKRLCEAYRKAPAEYLRRFEERNDMAVNEANFCCIVINEL